MPFVAQSATGWHNRQVVTERVYSKPNIKLLADLWLAPSAWIKYPCKCRGFAKQNRLRGFPLRMARLACSIDLCFKKILRISYRLHGVLCVVVRAYHVGIFLCENRTADNHLALRTFYTELLYGFLHARNGCCHKCA